MKQPNSQDKIKDLWQTTDLDARKLAYKFGILEASVRNIVKGLPHPEKVPYSLSKLHRVIGLMVADMRIASPWDNVAFASLHGISHKRLANIEKGYHDITITEIIKLGLLNEIASMDTSLLGDD